jgi:hypothetical protein
MPNTIACPIGQAIAVFSQGFSLHKQPNGGISAVQNSLNIGQGFPFSW